MPETWLQSPQIGAIRKTLKRFRPLFDRYDGRNPLKSGQLGKRVVKDVRIEVDELERRNPLKSGQLGKRLEKKGFSLRPESQSPQIGAIRKTTAQIRYLGNDAV